MNGGMLIEPGTYQQMEIHISGDVHKAIQFIAACPRDSGTDGCNKRRAIRWISRITFREPFGQPDGKLVIHDHLQGGHLIVSDGKHYDAVTYMVTETLTGEFYEEFSVSGW